MQNDTKTDQQVRENDRNGGEKIKVNAYKFNHAIPFWLAIQY